eukprot:1233500-Pleurochrysis_carterae.AAC.1
MRMDSAFVRMDVACLDKDGFDGSGERREAARVLPQCARTKYPSSHPSAGVVGSGVASEW